MGNLFGSIPHSDIVKICSDIYDDFTSILNCDKTFWINLVKFCIFENILYNDKDYFLQVKGIPMGNSFSSAFTTLFLFYYETNFINHNVTFFRYYDDIIVFNRDSFENISFFYLS